MKVRQSDNMSYSWAGYTLVEVLIAIGLMAALSAVALPPYLDWRKNMHYKEAAKELANTLNSAKSKAITLNKQHGVQFVASERSYQIGRFQNNHWSYSSAKGMLIQPQVLMNLNGTANSAVPPTPNIRFNTNGTSFDNYSIRIKDMAGTRYVVVVERTGRIKTSKVK